MTHSFFLFFFLIILFSCLLLFISLCPHFVFLRFFNLHFFIFSLSLFFHPLYFFFYSYCYKGGGQMGGARERSGREDIVHELQLVVPRRQCARQTSCLHALCWYAFLLIIIHLCFIYFILFNFLFGYIFFYYCYYLIL